MSESVNQWELEAGPARLLAPGDEDDGSSGQGLVACLADPDESGLTGPKARGLFPAGYVLLLLAHASMFLRPSELFPSVAELPFFQIFIVGALLSALPVLGQQLSSRSLRSNPGVLCVVAFLPAIMLSRAVYGNMVEALSGATDFAKVLVYFVLLVGLLNTTGRIRQFFQITIFLILGMATFATLRYYGVLDLTGITVLERGDGGVDPETGKNIVFQQLQASGVFSDPNDLALVLVTAILGSMHFVSESRSRLGQMGWGLMGLLLAFPFALTRSRGGFLSLLAGGMVWLVVRFGWRKALWIGLLAGPVLLVAFGGRQTNINLSDENDTAHGRVELWRDGIYMFRSAPVFGIGYGHFGDEGGLVAHNSYIHSYAELGFVGGTLFMGAFLLPMVVCRRMGRCEGIGSDLQRLRPCMMAVLVAYGVGLFSLSRPYVCTTYMPLGMLMAFCALGRADDPSVVPRWNGSLSRFILASSVKWIIFLYIFVHFAVK